MQELLDASTLLQDKEAMGETVANVRWLIAAGIRDFQAMLAAAAPATAPTHANCMLA